jgi:D-apiose dehydrogenase
MLRIGMIGAGWVTQHHLDAYRHLSERAQVVAIADPIAQAREGRAQTYAIPARYASAAEMLDREQLDAVDIAAPRETHVAMCELAAARGLAILCQKPLAPTFGGGADLGAKLAARRAPHGTRELAISPALPTGREMRDRR